MGDVEENNKMFTRKQLSEHLGVSERTIRRWEQKGWLPRIKIGNIIRYKWQDVKKLLDCMLNNQAR